MKLVDHLIEDLMTHFSGESFSKDIEVGKAHFFEGTGVLDEESQNFESKMIQFSYWYLFSRPLLDSSKTPIEKYAEEQVELSDENREIIDNLRAQRHSLFELLKISSDSLLVKDLFSEYKIKVFGDNYTEGFNKGDLFESRLVPHRNSFFFARSFCFHPPEAKKYIKKEVKSVNKKPVEEQVTAREELMFRLFKMNSRYEQYTHVPLELIYSNESKLKF